MFFRKRLSTKTMLANAERNRSSEDDDLDPNDPIVRLVRQARAFGAPAVDLHPRGPVEQCPTCDQETLTPIYASAPGADYEICIATHCPNCPPDEEDE